MSKFTFTTDDKSLEYCNLILEHMIHEMGATPEKALLKMNSLWEGLAFRGEDDLLYHQDVDYWAEVILLGKTIKRRQP